MTTPSKLTTLQWVLSKDRLIKSQGADPRERIHYTGHARPMAGSYARTIGNWCRLSTNEICNQKDPTASLATVRIGAFRQFRWHHNLMTRTEFEAHYGAHAGRPWLLGYVCWQAHRQAQLELIQANGAPASIGVACAKAVRDSELGMHRRLGLLPVEVVLYTRHFDRFVQHLPIQGLLTYDEWCDASDQTKTSYWDLGEGSDSTPWGDIGDPGPHLLADREPACFRPNEAGQLHGPSSASRATG